MIIPDLRLVEITEIAWDEYDAHCNQRPQRAGFDEAITAAIGPYLPLINAALAWRDSITSHPNLWAGDGEDAILDALDDITGEVRWPDRKRATDKKIPR